MRLWYQEIWSLYQPHLCGRRNCSFMFFLYGRQHSRYQTLTEAAHVQHIVKNTTKTLTEISSSARVWSTLFLLSPLTVSRIGRHWFHLLTLKGDHYADHRQNSRVRRWNVYASHTPENFSLLCHFTLTATLLMFPLVISAAKYETCYLYVVKLQTFSTLTQPYTR
jgi:hypothetical protein